MCTKCIHTRTKRDATRPKKCSFINQTYILDFVGESAHVLSIINRTLGQHLFPRQNFRFRQPANIPLSTSLLSPLTSHSQTLQKNHQRAATRGTACLPSSSHGKGFDLAKTCRVFIVFLGVFYPYVSSICEDRNIACEVKC